MPTSPNIDDNDSSHIQYSGSWNYVAGSTRQWEGGVSETGQVGATATFRFKGYQLWVWGTIPAGTGSSVIDVSIDGGPVSTVSKACGPNAVYNEQFFWSSTLQDTYHTVVVTNRGTSSVFRLDRFQFQTDDQTPLFVPPGGGGGGGTTPTPAPPPPPPPPPPPSPPTVTTIFGQGSTLLVTVPPSGTTLVATLPGGKITTVTGSSQTSSGTNALQTRTGTGTANGAYGTAVPALTGGSNPTATQHDGNTTIMTTSTTVNFTSATSKIPWGGVIGAIIALLVAAIAAFFFLAWRRRRRRSRRARESTTTTTPFPLTAGAVPQDSAQSAASLEAGSAASGGQYPFLSEKSAYIAFAQTPVVPQTNANARHSTSTTPSSSDFSSPLLRNPRILGLATTPSIATFSDDDIYGQRPPSYYPPAENIPPRT